MPINDTMERVRSTAVELGVYLPLGAYARVRDEVADVDRKRIAKLYSGLVDRGQERVEPIERLVRRRANRAQTEARQAVSRTQKTARKTANRAAVAANTVAPKMPRVGSPRIASELPIKSYASLTVDEIASELRGLTQSDLARVYKFEKAHENRSTILETIDSRLIELPIPTYDTLTASEINGRLDKLSESELKTIRRYESQTKDRSTIIERIDALLS